MENFGITWPYQLRKGHSDNPAQGACAMDAINWLVHGRHGDEPECACPLITAYVIRINDYLPDDHRQRLLAFLPRIAGSRSMAHEEARLRVLVLAAARIFAASAMEAAKLSKQAAALRAIPDDASYADIQARAARAAGDAEAARAAWAAWAAWAAGDAGAARAAAWAAARDAQRARFINMVNQPPQYFGQRKETQ